MAMVAGGWPIRAMLLMGVSLAGTPALAQQVAAAGDVTDAGEIIVTAERRSESLDKVPVSIQALGTAKLDQLQVQSFNDFARYLPSVSFQTAGPGFAQVYFRGVASGGDGNHSGPLPSVGIYLDEQPITTIGGTLDLHIYDIARIEALAGPQGTLYGASSQAGTIRYISNKPNYDKLEFGYDLEVNAVRERSVGGVVEGFANIPIANNLAARIVAWYDHDAGYIDNVAGTRTYSVPGITINNNRFVANNYNWVDTWGGRGQLAWRVTDDWTATATIMGQRQHANGFFGYDPNVGDLKVRHYLPERSQDDWYQTGLTLEGKISDFDLVYSGNYLERKVDTQSDYSDYSFFYDAFYTSYVDFIRNNAGQFINPSQAVVGKDRFSKLSQEVRLSSPDDWRIKFIVGGFYQRQTRDIEQQYVIDDLATNLSVTGRPDIWWLTKQYRIDRDYAIFGQATIDITDRLKLTGGGRYYWYDNSLIGFFGYGAGNPLAAIQNAGEAACIGPSTTAGAPCTNLADIGPNGSLRPRKSVGNGFTQKVNLSWQATDDALVYFTWSKGFRPGGINRRGTLPPYAADFLTNYEFGWKTAFFDKRLRVNGAIFQEDWDSIQLAFLGAVGLTEIQNAGNARIRGAEFDVTVIPTTGLTVTASGTYTDARLTTNYCRIANSPDCSLPGVNGESNFVRAPAGQQLPVTPEFKGNIIGRYEFPLGNLDAHVQAAVAYVGPRWAALRTSDNDAYGRMPEYTTVDLAFGIKKGDITAELYATNVGDSRGNIIRQSACAPGTCGAITYRFVTQPRTIGIKFGHRF